MNPDVDELKRLATAWDGQARELEAAPASIGGAAANAASVLSKQILEGDRRIKKVPRQDRGVARKVILQITVSGYQVVRFLYTLGDPRLSGNDTPAPNQANMSRIMSRGNAYSDEEMAQVLRCPRITAHAVGRARISDLDDVLGKAFGRDAKNLKTFAYVTGMRIGLAEQIEFGPFAMFGPEAMG